MEEVYYCRKIDKGAEDKFAYQASVECLL